ncbi:PEP-CTERM sorting domain-containing protein [Aeoliella mucimassa]|uniref:PEP-CTERM protein-sorting domain-containing protein n=1 Tax=Aeoliella mucimassa TaxID=2527972 RepID=A0A518AGN4_9BACT|nr:PEP-CTERM sorting domain-containing protein [Aeoliella mucimassa]QDU53849.1 hypothetical protein Pan181_00270 [Aeoliella mucimassa]
MLVRFVAPVMLAMFLVQSVSSSAATIDDFATWTLVQDPPHAGMAASLDSGSQLTLTAIDAVPDAVDIGYQSINGANVASSTSGFYFSPAADFTIAVDYAISSQSSQGLGGIGFGIGEDQSGANSAGVAVGVLDGIGLGVGGAARTNDVSDTTLDVLGAPLVGRLFVDYTASTGDIAYGYSDTPGASSFSVLGTFAARQQEWNDQPLLASFFLRSQDGSPVSGPLESGTLTAVFSNFEVLAGNATSVPEPASMVLLATAMGCALGVLRRR